MDCSYYAAAYMAQCLGHPEVIGPQVKAWREETAMSPEYYSWKVLGHQPCRWWDDYKDGPETYRRWWLGPEGGRGWVEGWLRDGYIGQAHVFRRPEYGHAVVVLEARDEGVLLMDPWPAFGGFVVEPWEWFLGQGPGNSGAHMIEAWYRR